VRGGSAGAARTLAWLGHPVTLLSLVVLVVNDHLLKDAYPGLVTGKLSDLAGLVVAPPLLALVATLLLARLRAQLAAAGSVAATGIGFVAMKATSSGATAGSAVWSVVNGPSVILADLTDLFALPGLALAWWVWTRARARPAPARLARLVRIAVLLPAAAFAVAATSAPYHPYAASVAEWDGAIVAGEGNGYHSDVNTRWQWLRVSEDGGRTWRDLEPAEVEAVETAVRRDPVPQLDCVPDRPTHCYRVVQGHLRVQETRDGGFTWTTAWEVPDEDRGRLARHYDDIGDLADYLASRAVVVHPAGEPGEYVVVVANGRDGYVIRDPAGVWQRVGFVADSYPYFTGPKPIGGAGGYAFELLWGFSGAVLSLAVAAEVLRRRRERFGRWPDKAGLAVLAAGPALLFAGEGLERAGEPFVAVAARVVGGLATAVGLAAWVALLVVGRVLSGRQWLVLVPAAVVTGGFLTLPLVTDLGPLARSPLDVVAAVLILAAGTTAGTTYAWALERPAPAPERAVRGNLLA
jgi:hypothetical protein